MVNEERSSFLENPKKNIYQALTKITNSDRLINNPDEISNTVLDVERSLQERMGFYAENNFKYYFEENLVEFPFSCCNVKDSEAYRYNFHSRSFTQFIEMFSSKIHRIYEYDFNPIRINRENSLFDFMHLIDEKLLLPFKIPVEFLSFSLESKNKQPRLFYNVIEYYGLSRNVFYQDLGYHHFNSDYFFLFKSEKQIPVCETKLNPTRFSCFKKLDKFLEEFHIYCETDFPQPFLKNINFPEVDVVEKQLSIKDFLVKVNEVRGEREALTQVNEDEIPF